MSQPFSGLPDPGNPSPFKRRVQSGGAQEMVRAAVRSGQRYCEAALRGAQRHGQDLWRRGKRNPRTVGLIGGAVAITLVGAYTLSASGAGRSLCPPAASSAVSKGQKSSQFLLLMDRVPPAVSGSELDILYDVCGLPSGTPLRGKVKLTQQAPTGKKSKAKPKPLSVTFQAKIDGPATRRSQQLELGSTKPGAYTLELSVVDNQGRERKRAQKLVVKKQ